MESTFLSNGDAVLTAESWTKREVFNPEDWIVFPAKDLANRSRAIPPPSIANDSLFEIGLFETAEYILAGKSRIKTRLIERAAERPLSASTRKYLASFAWLAFYISASAFSGAFSAYLFAQRAYLMLPASILAFVGFAVLALIRLSIHIQDQRRLSGEIKLKKAS